MIKLLQLIQEKEKSAIALMQYELLVLSNAQRTCELLESNKGLKKTLAIVKAEKKPDRKGIDGTEERLDPKIL